MKELIEAFDDLLGYDVWGDFPEGWYLEKQQLLLRHGRPYMTPERIKSLEEYVAMLEENPEG